MKPLYPGDSTGMSVPPTPHTWRPPEDDDIGSRRWFALASAVFAGTFAALVIAALLSWFFWSLVAAALVDELTRSIR